MRLHSVASIMYEPENVSELVNVIRELKEKKQPFHLLSAGSNIVFSERVEYPVIYLMSFDKGISLLDEMTIECGASVRIQSLLSAMKRYCLGGIEYLASVPSSIGGAVYMNAGRGRKYKKSISDYIVSVDYLDCSDMQIKSLPGTCDYSYRKSPFQEINAIVLKVRFRFLKQPADITEKLVKERLSYSKKYLSADKPSCGSIFNRVNPVVIRFFMGSRQGGAMFSKKTPNWISNMGNATASDIEKLVKRVIKIHQLFFMKYNLEVRFYK